MSKNQSSVSLLGKIAEYTEQLAENPRSTAFVHLAEAYRQMGLLDDALSVAAKGIGALPSFAPGYASLGRIQAQKGDLAAAAQAFGQALEIDGRNLPALKGLARVRMLRGENSLARELLERAAVLKPDDAALRQMLSTLPQSVPAVRETPSPPVRPSRGAPAAGEGRSAGSPQRGGNDPISTVTIAEIYIKQGFLRRALRVYRDILFVDPENGEIRRKLVALKKEIHAREQRESGAAPEPVASAKPAEPAQAPVTEISAPGMTPEVRVDSSMKALKVFNRWLDSIRMRREHVQ